MENFFIEDGCTKTDIVPRRKGLHPEFSFDYRLALPEKINKHFRQVRQNPDSEIRLESEFMLDHLIAWSIIDGDGNKIKPDLEKLRKLHPSARVHLMNAICGFAEPGELEEIRKN